MAAALLAVGAIVAAGAFVRLRMRTRPHVESPSLTVADLDPAIAQLVDSARAEVAADPESAQAWSHLGMVFAANRFDDEAIHCFEQAEALHSTDGRLPYLRGVILAEDHPADAVAPLRKGVEMLAGELPTVRLQLAAVQMKLGQIDDAENQYRQLLSVDQANADAHFGLGKVCVTRGRWPQAVDELTTAAATPRLHAAATVLLATARAHRDGSTDATPVDAASVSAMSRKNPAPDPVLVALRPYRVGLRVRLEQAERTLQADRPEEALPLLRELTHDYPKADEAWRAQARALFTVGATTEAEASTRRAIELNPDSGDSLKQLADELLYRHEPEEAASQLRHAIRVRPTDVDAHETLGSCLMQLHQPDAAMLEYHAAIRLRPDLVSAYLKLAEVLAQTEKNDGAIATLQQALLIEPGNRTALERLKQLPGGATRP